MLIESGLLEGIQRDSLAPVVEAEVCRRAMNRAKTEHQRAGDPTKGIGKLRAEVANLTDAIASGALRSSPNVSVPRTRAELRKLVGELRAETTDKAIEIWSTQTAQQALMRLIGGRQQINLVAGARFSNFLPDTGRRISLYRISKERALRSCCKRPSAGPLSLWQTPSDSGSQSSKHASQK